MQTCWFYRWVLRDDLVTAEMLRAGLKTLSPNWVLMVSSSQVRATAQKPPLSFTFRLSVALLAATGLQSRSPSAFEDKLAIPNGV